MLYDKGTNRRAFMLGQVDKYTWKDTGSSFGLADVLAAYLLAQLEQREVIQGKRRAVHERYAEPLAPHADELGFELMRIAGRTASRRTTCSTCCCPTRDRRNDVLEAMRKAGVQRDLPLRAAAHLRRRPGRSRARPTECPVTEDVSGRLLRLPFYNNLGERDLDRAVERVPRRRARPPSGSSRDAARPASRAPRRWRSRTTGGTAPAPSCCTRCFGAFLGHAAPRCSTSAAPTPRAWAGCAATTRT